MTKTDWTAAEVLEKANYEGRATGDQKTYEMLTAFAERIAADEGDADQMREYAIAAINLANPAQTVDMPSVHCAINTLRGAPSAGMSADLCDDLADKLSQAIGDKT